ncbi:MAG: hypothetical protein DMG05_15655 [Acidobacteria bacterium]|nr:MAG: hypothetical protein DMG05_15655 [Acidobacteriota bacterium]
MKNWSLEGHSLLLSLVFLLSAVSWGLDALAQSETNFALSSHGLKVDVDLVTLSFSVKDKNKRYVENLRKEDVVLLEDEISQEIAFFEFEPTPLSLVVLVDVSESTGPFAKQIETTSRIVSDLLNPQDEAAVIAFSTVPSLLQEFTHSRNRVLTGLERACQKFSGATNINDSIYLASRKLNSAETNHRRVILLISDGVGNRGERERALKELRTSGATLIGIGLGLTSRLFRGAVGLSQWVKETGGNLLLYSVKPDLKKELKATLEQIRSQYAIGYVSNNKNKDGRFRRLRVEISRNSPLAPIYVVIQNPEGYFAPQQSLWHY